MYVNESLIDRRMAEHKIKGEGGGVGGQRKPFLYAISPHFGQARQTLKCAN